MNFHTFCLHLLNYSFLLLIEVTEALFPSLDFIEDGTNVVLWLANAALSVCHLGEKLYNVRMF